MFVRFRDSDRRLQASLVQVRRASGKPRSEHIGSLGAVDIGLSVRGRLAFWTKLPGRLAALGNRVGSEEHAKIYAAVAARIPMVTPDEQRAVQEENANDDERFWGAMREMNAADVEGHKALKAKVEEKIAEGERRAAEAAEKAENAKERLGKLRQGESLSGGFGKKLDVAALMKAAGITPRQLDYMVALTTLTEEEFKELVKRTAGVKPSTERAELRRILRARRT